VEANKSTAVRRRARQRGQCSTATLGLIVRPQRGQFRYWALNARVGDDVPQFVIDAVAEERSIREGGGDPPDPSPGEPPGDPPPATADEGELNPS
jgi:hypothetical protein